MDMKVKQIPFPAPKDVCFIMTLVKSEAVSTLWHVQWETWVNLGPRFTKGCDKSQIFLKTLFNIVEDRFNFFFYFDVCVV